MAKKEEMYKQRTFREVLDDFRRFVEDNDLLDKPFDGCGSVMAEKKVGNRTRSKHMDIATGYVTLSESISYKY